MPIADCTLLVNKDKYQMHILTFGKEIALMTEQRTILNRLFGQIRKEQAPS